MDPYSEIQYAWTFARENRVADFQVKGKPDEASLETLQSVFFTFTNIDFPSHAKTRSVRIAATGRDLKFTYWLQPGNAPVVYIIPGLGSHRLAETSLALAELIYKNGFSAVCLSSPFSSEFMEHASTAAMPAYLPVDGHDLHVALTEIDRHLRAANPGRLGEKALMGYSMGALESLFVAAEQSTNQLPLVKFDRYVAINTPVRMVQGVNKLDEFYRAPLEWPAAERTDNIENTHAEPPVFYDRLGAQKNNARARFRFVLRDILYSSQRRNNQGILHHPFWNWRRNPVYQEILQYSYQDYFNQFVIPYYRVRGLTTASAETFEKAGDLRTYEPGLRSNPDIRVIVNQNDFLLSDDDLAWLSATFTPNQLTVFDKGGHLGNLSNTNVQKSLLGALSGLQSTGK